MVMRPTLGMVCILAVTVAACTPTTCNETTVIGVGEWVTNSGTVPEAEWDFRIRFVGADAGAGVAATITCPRLDGVEEEVWAASGIRVRCRNVANSAQILVHGPSIESLSVHVERGAVTLVGSRELLNGCEGPHEGDCRRCESTILYWDWDDSTFGEVDPLDRAPDAGCSDCGVR